MTDLLAGNASKVPLISILTPSWNRGRYLERVWIGLNSQTYRNFEWIVCDDGSIDDTQARLREFGAKSSFPIEVISASVRIGKARMDNEAVCLARGVFILWNDSDDYLVPTALERLISTWDTIPVDQQSQFVGLTALCADESGTHLTASPKMEPFDTSWNDLSEKHKITGDMLFFARAEALKSHPFPEVDLIIPESVVWTALGNQKVRFFPDALLIKEYRAENAISFTGKMEYNRGRAYSLAQSQYYLRSYRQKTSARIWRLVTFLRYCLHGDIDIFKAWSLWQRNSSLTLFILLLPFAVLLAVKDRLQKKVVKTHVQFERAKCVVKIESNHFEPRFQYRGSLND